MPAQLNQRSVIQSLAFVVLRPRSQSAGPATAPPFRHDRGGEPPRPHTFFSHLLRVGKALDSIRRALTTDPVRLEPVSTIREGDDGRNKAPVDLCSPSSTRTSYASSPPSSRLCSSSSPLASPFSLPAAISILSAAGLRCPVTAFSSAFSSLSRPARVSAEVGSAPQ